MDEVPPEHVRRLGAAAADRVARTTTRISAACVAGVVLGLLLALAWLRAGLIMAVASVSLLGVYLIAARRARLASRAIAAGPWQEVFVVGWCRPPDGCNYAVFDLGADDQTEPNLVVRLPLRRAMKEGDAWLCGAPNEGMLRSVALVAPSGELLGTGRVLGRDIARKRWVRRAKQPPRFVARPPDDWLPPGGS